MKKLELFNNEAKELPYQRLPEQLGLYHAKNEHDACGVGMLVNIHGEKSHDIVESALKVLENMRHRGAEGADNKQETVPASCSRFRMNLSCYKVYPSLRKGNTEPVCSSCPKTNKIRQPF